MDNPHLTLQHFFHLKEKELTDTKRSDFEATKKVATIKEKLKKESKDVRWSLVSDEMTNKILDLLNIKIKDILVGAWDKSKEIKRYLNKDACSPDETILVSLAEHTIRSEHKPSLELLLNDKPIGDIDFTISIALHLNGIILKIEGGQIRQIHTGDCKGSGRIKCEDFTLLEKETEAFSIPGVIEIGEAETLTAAG